MPFDWLIVREKAVGLSFAVPRTKLGGLGLWKGECWLGGRELRKPYTLLFMGKAKISFKILYKEGLCNNNHKNICNIGVKSVCKVVTICVDLVQLDF